MRWWIGTEETTPPVANNEQQHGNGVESAIEEKRFLQLPDYGHASKRRTDGEVTCIWEACSDCM